MLHDSGGFDPSSSPEMWCHLISPCCRSESMFASLHVIGTVGPLCLPRQESCHRRRAAARARRWATMQVVQWGIYPIYLRLSTLRQVGQSTSPEEARARYGLPWNGAVGRGPGHRGAGAPRPRQDSISRFAVSSLDWGCHAGTGVECPWELGFLATHVGRVTLARQHLALRTEGLMQRLCHLADVPTSVLKRRAV